jgi:AcrR family transcriptional regulator
VASGKSADRKSRVATAPPSHASTASAIAAEALRDRIVDHAHEVISRQVDKQADKVVAKATKHLAKIETISGYLGPADVWMRGATTTRKPRLSCDDLAVAGMRIADTEGLEALTMRRLAAELDVGTMSIYHYVQSKDELLTLVIDASIKEVLLPPGTAMPSGWREAIALLAERRRAALARHAWVLDITEDPPIGPNAVRYFDQAQQAIALFPGSVADQLDLMMAVEEYVFGYCVNARNHLQDDALTSDDFFDYLNDLIAANDYPTLHKMIATSGVRGVWNEVHDHYRDTGRFARNLNRLLDGFEP